MEGEAVRIPLTRGKFAIVDAQDAEMVQQYRGVSWRKRDAKWVVNIKVDGKYKHVGMYADERDAARAYNAVAIKYHGDNARLNQVSD